MEENIQQNKNTEEGLPKDKYFQVLNDLYQNKDKEKTYSEKKPDTKKIDDVLEEKERIKNEGLRQDIGMKKYTLWLLFGFLSIETFFIFMFSFFQAIHWPWGFKLEEWSFNLLVGATITQITAMLIIAVKHLFPDKE